MNSTESTYGSFSLRFSLFEETGEVTIHPQMMSVYQGISPTGKYHIYCIHPFHGSSIFLIEQDDKGVWICKIHPLFISVNFIAWLGQQIESRIML